MPSRQPPPPDPAALPAASAAAVVHQHISPHHLAPVAAALVLAAAIFFAAGAVAAVLFYRRLARRRAAATAPAELKPPPPPLRRFSHSQLRRATAGFAPSHRLGQGGFGPVFRGALSSGQPVAVKLMDSGSLQGDREFHNELALASKISPLASLTVVPPIGYCSPDDSSLRAARWRFWRRRGQQPERRLLLVYELMHNGSLQDALLSRKCPELMAWERRFSVALDIALGIQFLHTVCDPPIIHGDIKPSNILLDSCFSARIADFGLARLKTSEEAQLNEEEAKGGSAKNEPAAASLSPEICSRHNDGGEGEDDASAMGETAASTTTTGVEDLAGNHAGSGIALTEKSGDDDDGFAAAGFDRLSLDRGTASRGGRKNWWWRQDTAGGASSEQGGSVKDYVMEWIRSEIKKERPKSDWITAPAASDCPPMPPVKPERKKQQRRLEWWASLDEDKLAKKEKCRPAREWWREEFCEELTNKQKRRTITKSHSSVGEQQWWQKDDNSMPATPDKKKWKKKKSMSRGSRASVDWCMDNANGEARTAIPRSSRDWASGDIPRSGNVSSTPSMRGTVCYVAPEYSGGGPLSEKCDIYSFGVLLLVLVSGRRPLQVTASPMSEFERANLISWARHLSHLGRLLELLDTSLLAVDMDQALLCITVALLCLQRSPARRPSIKEIVEMLSGQSEPPHLPMEFSPSPPGGFTFKSRKKAR